MTSEASSSGGSSAPQKNYKVPEKVKFWTRGPNVFTAVQEYFGEPRSELVPPIFAPSLLRRSELEVVDNHWKFWSDPTKWFESGKQVTWSGNASLNVGGENELHHQLARKMFFDQWNYYEKVTIPHTVPAAQESPDMLVVAMPGNSPEEQESVKSMNADELVEIRPEILMWVISAATVMGSMNKDVIPLIIPTQESKYNDKFDLHKHFDVRGPDGNPLPSRGVKTTYYKMLLLTIGALFHYAKPAKEINNSLFVSAHWKQLSALRDGGLNNPLFANFDIENSPHVLLSYQAYQRCFEALFSEEIAKARLAADQFLV